MDNNKKKTTKSNTKKKSNNKKISKTSTKSGNSTKIVKMTEPKVKKVVEVKTINKEQPKKKPNILLYVGILLTIAVLIILIVIFSPKKDATNDGLKHNTNKSFIEDKVVNGIIITNIKCSFDGKDSTISYTMINKTAKIINLNNYDIIIKDKEGTRLTKISIHITNAINPLESLDRVDKVIGIDLSDAYEFDLTINTK